VLPVAHRDVVGDAVAGDGVERVAGRDVAPAPADEETGL